MNTIYLIFKINLGATIPFASPLWPPLLQARSRMSDRGLAPGFIILPDT